MFGRLREDIGTAFARDPAARNWWEIVTCYPGLHAVWSHRIAHALWKAGLTWPARMLSHLARFATGIEIHPGAKLGRRCFIDHGMGIVIGETAEVGDDVLMYKGVVLGGISLEHGKRHPTIGHHVVLGTNAVVLGPIKIGDRARIGSGAVVIRPVPADSTAVGIPARVVRGPGVETSPAAALQHDRLPDPVAEVCRHLSERIDALERQIQDLQGHPATVAHDIGDRDDAS